MSNSYKDLLQQRALLDAQIAEARQRELANAIAQARALITEFQLTPEDLFSSTKPRNANAGQKVAAKYRNPTTGETWTGRGKAPKWIADQDRSQFLIA